MSEPRRIAVVHSYDELHAALRARAAELQVTRETLDAVSGLQGGYCGKLLAPVPIKAMGRESMGPMLGALGLRLVVEEDAEALLRVLARLSKRERPARMLNGGEHGRITFRLSRRFLRKIARMATAARLQKIGKRARKRIAKKAANARWLKARVAAAHAAGTSPAAAPPAPAPARPPRCVGTGAATGRAQPRSPGRPA